MKPHTDGSDNLRTHRWHAKRLQLLGICVSICIFARETLAAESPAAPPHSERIATYRSGRIELTTDLPTEDAAALLKRLESTLRTISKYWRRPLGRQIVCFVADDLANWPDEALPHPQAKLVIEHVGGCTQLQSVQDSKSADAALVAHIYATSTQGIAEHELVHAYCLLTFGTCGPEWYKEGMAEMAFHHGTNRLAVECPIDVAQMLRTDRAKTVREIIGAGEFTQPIAARFDELNVGSGLEHARDQWEARDSETVDLARQAYHRSWALCYFLANNPNYHERFRQLGIGYLHRMEADFDTVFGPDAQELAFEFDLFLREIDDGYRVDLCRWNWKKEFAVIGEGEAIDVRVLAARGYQPSGLLVTAGETYHYAAEGRWTSCHRRVAVTADGNYLGHGGLEAAIVSEFTLSEPFLLGAKGSFAAARTGKLYLRCRDDWHALADNEGSLVVRLQRGGRGEIVPAP